MWAGNGSCIEEIWENFKDIIFEAIKRNVPQKFLNKIPDPEYNNKEVNRLKAKLMKMYNKKKSELPYQAKLKRLPKKRENAQVIFLRSVLQNEDRNLAEF